MLLFWTGVFDWGRLKLKREWDLWSSRFCYCFDK